MREVEVVVNDVAPACDLSFVHCRRESRARCLSHSCTVRFFIHLTLVRDVCFSTPVPNLYMTPTLHAARVTLARRTSPYNSRASRMVLSTPVPCSHMTPQLHAGRALLTSTVSIQKQQPVLLRKAGTLSGRGKFSSCSIACGFVYPTRHCALLSGRAVRCT